jgi:RNA polymerase sigma-70 factor (ECF subfamily)
VEWADLIGRVASRGDREAFKSLFEHFAPRIKGFMLKAGCSADEAEEIAQNTLIAVWRKAGQFDPDSTGAAAWIFTIARNLRIDSLRRTARTSRIDVGVELADMADPTEPADLMLRMPHGLRRLSRGCRRSNPASSAYRSSRTDHIRRSQACWAFH